LEIVTNKIKSYESYEQVATYLLNQCAREFGLSKVEGKQKVFGLLSQSEWEIDAKGICEGNKGFVIIECRRYTTSKQKKKDIGSLAWEILDTGAQGGIIVSHLGLQEGAKKVVRAGRIVNVQLSLNCTPHEFAMEFLNKIFIGLGPLQIPVPEISVKVELSNPCQKCGQMFTVIHDETVCPKCQLKLLTSQYSRSLRSG
jgi:hypothetical protein